MKLFFNSLIGSTGSVSQPQEDFVPVIFELSQSNGGQAEADRIPYTDQIVAAGLTKMTYTKTPANCRIWYKPDMDMVNDGSMQDISAGVNTSQYTTARTFGTEIALCPLLKQDTANKVYYIKAMRGGTALYQDAGLEDWNANSVNDLLDSALQVYTTPAIQQIKAENPGKDIKVVLLRHQGESDNTDIERNAYYQNSVDFLAKIRNFEIDGVKYFANSPFIDTLLYYRPLEQQEIDMNALKVQFASEQPNCYTIDISNQPRKIDLTTEQTNGSSPRTMPDNEHTSYLGQLQKGESAYDVLKQINWI